MTDSDQRTVQTCDLCGRYCVRMSGESMRSCKPQMCREHGWMWPCGACRVLAEINAESLREPVQ